MNDVYLDRLDMSCLDKCLEWHQSDELYSTLCGHRNPYIEAAGETTWLTARMERDAQGAEWCRSIFAFDKGPPWRSEYIGNVYLRPIDKINRNAEFHIFIGEPKYRGLGFGRRVTVSAIGAAQKMGLHKLYLSVLRCNQRAIRVYEWCGFKTVGTLTDHVLKADGWHDVVMMELMLTTWVGPPGTTT